MLLSIIIDRNPKQRVLTCEQNLATPSWALQILNAELILSSAEVSQLLEAGLPETAASGAHNFTQPGVQRQWKHLDPDVSLDPLMQWPFCPLILFFPN